MKKTFRKAIAVLLAVLMVVLSVPFSAFAANLEVGGTPAIGWWGDNNWKGWENPNIPQGEQNYDGWNSAPYELALSWADAISIESDLGMSADAQEMMNNYKPVLTITVSDQGTADNRIYRQYYGYSAAYNYNTVKAAGNILNPADLKAGQRIAVTFEIGGFDMLYAGQLKGTIDTTKLAYAYYTLDPSKTDRWKKCSSTQTTQAFITRGYGFYGDAATDGGAMATDNATGQFYTPYSCNTAVPSSAYVGKDKRTIGDNGMIICTLSMEVLQDCNLAEAIDFTKDNDNNAPAGITTFTPYDPDEIGSTRNRFNLDTSNTDVTAGLIAVNYNDYDAAGSAECTHTNTTQTLAKAANCTEPGNSAYWTCNECGKMFLDEACANEITEVPTIPATGHSLTETKANAATCTAPGNSAYWTCSVCNKMFLDAAGANEISEIPTISATGHSLIKTEEVPATCTAPGTEAYWTCTACDKMFSNAEGTTEISAPVPIPKEDHNYQMAKTEATCTEKSSEVYTCSVCGDTYTTHVDPAKGHDHKMVKTEATCTEASSEVYTCSVCGDTYTTHVDPATGHTYGAWSSNDNGTHSRVCTNAGDDTQTEDCSYKYEVTKAPTIDETGIGTYTCTKCSYSYTKVLDKVTCTHTDTIKSEEVPATCTAPGTEAYWTCKACNKMFSDASCTVEIAAPVVIPATGHSLVKTEEVPATCTATGTEAYWRCTACGKMFSDAEGTTEISAPVTIPKEDHDYKMVKTAATCTEKSSEVYTCSVCGDTYTTHVDPATGHTEVSANNAVSPSFDAPGKESDTICSVCGATIKTGATIPALVGVSITVEATDMGRTYVNGTETTNGGTVKVLKDSTATLTATPVEGADFIGWAMNGKIVTSADTLNVKAFMDVTYTPVFTETAAAEFTVVFVDNYGNVLKTQTVVSADQIEAPTAPTRPGYTFAGWSVDIATLKSGATVYAQFQKDAASKFTVTATGCTITTAAGASASDEMTDVAYDTLVTITSNSGTASYWKIGDSPVAFGESYTFYVGSDVTVVPQFDSSVAAVPTVSNVAKTEHDIDGYIKVTFLATRSMTDDCKLVANGFVYGKNLADTYITLDDVDGTTVKRVQNATNAEQFSLTYSLSAQTGTMVARAYLVYTDAEGATQIIYADPQTYTYA